MMLSDKIDNIFYFSSVLPMINVWSMSDDVSLSTGTCGTSMLKLSLGMELKYWCSFLILSTSGVIVLNTLAIAFLGPTVGQGSSSANCNNFLLVSR